MLFASKRLLCTLKSLGLSITALRSQGLITYKYQGIMSYLGWILGSGVLDYLITKLF